MHDGCPNVDYQKLPLETGADNLSLHDARVKLKELAENGFPEDPSEAEMCDLLHGTACVGNIAGQLSRSKEK